MKLDFEYIKQALLNYDAKSEYKQASIIMLRNIFKEAETEQCDIQVVSGSTPVAKAIALAEKQGSKVVVVGHTGLGSTGLSTKPLEDSSCRLVDQEMILPSFKISDYQEFEQKGSKYHK